MIGLQVNFGPVHQLGLPVISDQELETEVEAVLRDTNPQVILASDWSGLIT